MNKKRIYFLVLCIVGFSIVGLSQSTESIDKENSDSVLIAFKTCKLKEFGFTIKLIDGWDMETQKKDKLIKFKKNDNISFFNIQLRDINYILDSVFVDSDKKENDISMQQLVDKINALQEIPNATVSTSFKRSSSKQQGNIKSSTTYKTIDDKGFIIRSSIDKSCNECTNEFEYIIKSIQVNN